MGWTADPTHSTDDHQLAHDFDRRETEGRLLATHDANADGVIDVNDAIYGNLRVWRDLNGNGITDDGELFILAQTGIACYSACNIDP